MFMKKDKPELFELLRTNKSKLSPTSPSAAKEEVVAHTAPTNSEPTPIPYNQPSSTTSKIYPKWKMPFPTNIKSFHPIATKPKEQTLNRPSIPDKTTRYQAQENKKPINYRKFVIPTVIVVALIIIAYIILVPPSQNKQPIVTNSNITDTNNTTTATTNHLWSNRLVNYKDNADGQNSCNKRLKFLMEKNISGVFTKKEQIEGVPSISIYVGKYQSLEEAKKEQRKLKNLHFQFKNIQIVELGEK
jgi:hypothetical protein